MSKIEWTDDTWNPTVGCSRVSPGCDRCYAMGQAHRKMQAAHAGLTVRTDHGVDWTGEVRCLPERLDTPLQVRRPTMWFVDSMSDLFHPSVPAEFICEVFAVMGTARWHTFQVLTKRPQGMARLLRNPGFGGCLIAALEERGVDLLEVGWPLSNVWLGTSVETQRYADMRIPHLLQTPAAVRFLSCEPLLGPIDLGRHLATRDGEPRIGWVIAGGESGPGARPMDPGWVRDLRDQCDRHGVPFFFKQWGEWAPGAGGDGSALMARLGKRAAGRELDGRTWDQYPTKEAPAWT